MVTTKTPKKISTTYVYALGRRKAAVATVKLFKGKGESIINNRSPDKYFPLTFSLLNLPFTLTDTLDKYHYAAKIVGGVKPVNSLLLLWLFPGPWLNQIRILLHR